MTVLISLTLSKHLVVVTRVTVVLLLLACAPSVSVLPPVGVRPSLNLRNKRVSRSYAKLV